MAETKKTKKSAVKKENTNPVGRPKNKKGIETLMNNKKSFRINNNNIVFDKYGDALFLGIVISLFTAIFLYLILKACS